MSRTVEAVLSGRLLLCRPRPEGLVVIATAPAPATDTRLAMARMLSAHGAAKWSTSTLRGLDELAEDRDGLPGEALTALSTGRRRGVLETRPCPAGHTVDFTFRASGSADPFEVGFLVPATGSWATADWDRWFGWAGFVPVQ